MAPSIPRGEPACVRAGDSWQWQQSFSDYPSSDGWALSYVLAGPGKLALGADEIDVEADDITRTVYVEASKTQGLAPGTYSWVALMTGSSGNAGKRETVGTGTLVVEPDLAEALGGEFEDPDERLLRQIDSVIHGRVTDDVQEVTIAGRAITKIPILELFAIRSRLEARVKRRQAGPRAGIQRFSFT